MKELDKLVDIPRSSWETLRDLFKPNWPANIVGYYTIDNYINWFNKDANLRNVNIYSLNNDWSDGTYLIVDRYQVFIFTLEESCGRLKRGLLLLDWSGGLYVSSFMKRYRPVVEEVIQLYKLECYFLKDNFMFFYDKDEAKSLKVDVPEGITMRKLSEENIDQVNEVWPFKHSSSTHYLKRLILFNENIGAFDKNNQLIAWCLRNQCGSLGVLQVVESQYRSGLGSLVVRYLTKKFSEDNLDTIAFVVNENLPSCGMFRKNNFKVIDEVTWVFTKPIDPNVTTFNWDKD